MKEDKKIIKSGPIKIFSLEADEFFKLFLQDALVVYNPREVVLTFASNIKDMLDMLSRALPEVPDIIFLSLAVPAEVGGKIELQGGLRVLKILRENENFKKVPIIIFSKYKEKSLQKKAAGLGATKYLIKGECMPRDVAEAVAFADGIHTESMKSIRSIFPWR